MHTVLEKIARARTYKEFDTLSPASQQRLVNTPGMLRSSEQVHSGIAKGNEALLSKKNISFKRRQFDPTGIDAMLGTTDDYHFQPGWIGSGVTAPDLAHKGTVRKQQYQWAATLGKPQTLADLKARDPLAVRHEIHESMASKKVPDVRGYSRSAKGQQTGLHMSLGVLARDRNVMSGFSYTKPVQDMTQLRNISGENELMSAVAGKTHATSRYSGKEIQKLDKAAPADFKAQGVMTEKAPPATGLKAKLQKAIPGLGDPLAGQAAWKTSPKVPSGFAQVKGLAGTLINRFRGR